ncbi:MAG: dTDP-4-dehydrorhamnose 3,5-epimerase [Methylophilaceae bacterium]
MRFVATPIEGAFIVEMEAIEDERGFFARTYCRDEFIAQGLNPDLVQCNVSFNKHRGTLRGMHYQQAPYAESKLVRCTQGEMVDVVVDVRPSSTSYKKWFSVELSAANRRAFYIPEGVAHGFQTLTENTEVFYQMGSRYHPEAARGIRWNDPEFAIDWPLESPVMNDKDKSYVLWSEQ